MKKGLVHRMSQIWREPVKGSLLMGRAIPSSEIPTFQCDTKFGFTV